MEHAYAHLMHLLSGHPVWALVVIFLAAFLEAVAVIGTFIPGSTAMFLGGALVGTGSLNLGWTLGCALAGAVAGDALSYWLGSRFKTGHLLISCRASSSAHPYNWPARCPFVSLSFWPFLSGLYW